MDIRLIPVSSPDVVLGPGQAPRRIDVRLWATTQPSDVVLLPLSLPVIAGAGAGSTQIWSVTGSGGITLAGAAGVARTWSVAGAGGLTLAGSAPVSRVRVVTGSGGVTLAGSASVSRAWAAGGSGGLHLGGAAVLARAFAVTGSGGLMFDGEATTEFIGGAPALWTVVGAGGLQLGGSAFVEWVPVPRRQWLTYAAPRQSAWLGFRRGRRR